MPKCDRAILADGMWGLQWGPCDMCLGQPVWWGAWWRTPHKLRWCVFNRFLICNHCWQRAIIFAQVKWVLSHWSMLSAEEFQHWEPPKTRWRTSGCELKIPREKVGQSQLQLIVPQIREQRGKKWFSIFMDYWKHNFIHWFYWFQDPATPNPRSPCFSNVPQSSEKDPPFPARFQT